jgi:hypothetical protein
MNEHAEIVPIVVMVGILQINDVYYYFLWLCSPARDMASSFTKFLDHTTTRHSR